MTPYEGMKILTFNRKKRLAKPGSGKHSNLRGEGENIYYTLSLGMIVGQEVNECF